MIMFFKQKSSYEGRISDWSSDVCSSDLLFEFDSVLRDPDHLLGDLDVDIGSLDLLRDIEPDDPPVRLGEDHAPFGERHARRTLATRSEEHTSELQSLMRISYAVFCLQKKKTNNHGTVSTHQAPILHI